MDKTNYAFFERQFMPLQNANVNIMNQTFMYGLGVFEGIRGYWNAKEKCVYLFRLREHIERMFDSIRIMRLQCDYTVDQVCELITELVRMNEPTGDIYIRPSVYASSLAISPCLAKSKFDLCILTIPFGDYVDTQAGLRVGVSSWRRVEDNAIPARAKINGCYVNTALAKTDAALAGLDDCIMLSESGHVAEGSAMNVFIVKKGQLITTSTTENILEGITRSTIMEMAEREFGLQAYSRCIDRSELYTADEIFFCGTGAQVAPVAEIDARKVGSGSYPITEMIRDKYIELCRGNVPGYESWLTRVEATAVVSPLSSSVVTAA
jgi:branched-chain amino acid aminotransferase